MISRCYNQKDWHYKNYGGRGIVVCDEWHDFYKFEEWAMSHGWAEGLTIDRIDNDGCYEPNNCRWADRYTQQNNTRQNRRYTYNGETKTMKQWADTIGISYYTLRNRLDTGWTIDDALEEGVRETARIPKEDRLITFRGETKLLTQWAKDLGIGFSTLRSRIEQRGWSVEKAFTTPVKPQKRLICYKGETHSLTEWADILGVSRSALYTRLNQYGWPVERAFETPMQEKRKRKKEG